MSDTTTPTRQWPVVVSLACNPWPTRRAQTVPRTVAVVSATPHRQQPERTSMTTKQYSHESVRRALNHHELAGVVHTWSPPGHGQSRYKINFADRDLPELLTLREAYLVVFALAAAEAHARKSVAS